MPGWKKGIGLGLNPIINSCAVWSQSRVDMALCKHKALFPQSPGQDQILSCQENHLYVNSLVTCN